MINDNISFLRKYHKLSQEEMAEKQAFRIGKMRIVQKIQYKSHVIMNLSTPTLSDWVINILLKR